MSEPTFQIVRNGKVIGSFTLPEVAIKLKDGTILPTDTYWTAGMTEWASVIGLRVVLDALVTPSANKAPSPSASARSSHVAVGRGASIGPEGALQIEENMLGRGVLEKVRRLRRHTSQTEALWIMSQKITSDDCHYWDAYWVKTAANLLKYSDINRAALGKYDVLSPGMSKEEVRDSLGKYYAVWFDLWVAGLQSMKFISEPARSIKFKGTRGSAFSLDYHRYWIKNSDFENWSSLEGTLAFVYKDNKLGALLPGDMAKKVMDAHFG